MQKKKQFIFTIGAFFILMVKFYVRAYLKVPSSLALARDVAPNLISAFILPFGIDLFFKRWVAIVNKKSLVQVCLGGLFFLVCNEIAQLFPIFRRTFDFYDILFSCIGIALSYIVYQKYFLKPIANYYDQQ